MKITYCIFDLDGTLLDTLEALTYTTNLVLKRLEMEPVDSAMIRKFVGDGYEMLLMRALRFRGDETLVHLEESKRLYTELFSKHSLYHVKPYPGVVELLEELRRRKIRLAVLSNKPHERTVENIERMFGRGIFDYVAGERPGIPRKPDPAGVLQILKEFGETPERGFYFGDTNTDMRTGLGAGLVTVGVTWGFRDRQELEAFHPQYVIRHPGEVLAYIDEKEML